jgi:hypothetical protein
MRLLQRILIAAVAATAMVVSATAAMAHGLNGSTMNLVDPASRNYSGSWPVTVTRSQHSNWTGCLTLTENASGRSASLVIGSQRFPSGSFLVVNHTLVATITAQAYSQNAGLLFIGSAGRGAIGPGVFEDVYGGSDFDSGALAFGMKGGC